MYESNWFSVETMTTLKETQDNEKMWPKSQTFLENVYITRKRYINAKGQPNNSINKITEANLNMYLAAIDTKSAQENKEHKEHIQQVTEQNAILLALVQEQQKKIKGLMKQSKNLIKAMNKDKPATGPSGSTRNLQEKPKNGGAHTAKR